MNDQWSNSPKKPWDFTYSLAKCRAVRQSPTALLVERDNKTFWVPKKVIHEKSHVKIPGNTGTLVVSLWFAVSKKGLNLDA